MLNAMTRWYPLEQADADIFTTAPEIHRYVIRLPVSPERVWESLASDASLSAWGPGVQSLTWTTPRPFEVGTTREVVLALKAVTVRERFFRWDEGKGYSFYVYEANRPMLARMAEDYVVEADGSGALLTWTVAIELAARLTPFAKIAGPMNRFAFGQVARSAKGYFAKHP